MPFGPVANGSEGLDQRPTELREGVLDGGGNRRGRCSEHQAVALQALEGLTQDFVRNSLDSSAELTEAMGPFTQKANDQGRPFVRNPVQRLSRWALFGVDVVVAPAHADMTVLRERVFQGTPKTRRPFCLGGYLQVTTRHTPTLIGDANGSLLSPIESTAVGHVDRRTPT